MKPRPPLSRLLYETGSIDLCDKCHSSIQRKWYDWLIFYSIKRGCIQPQCENYEE